MDIIKFDIMTADPQRIAVMAKKFKDSGMKLLAEKVETKDQYLTHSKMGFDLFQGYYFHMPENIESTMNLHTEAYDLLNLVQMIKDDDDTKEIENFFRSKPDMSYNLIKYLNSSQVGLKSEIYSIEHAIALIGRKQLLKWLLLYLYSEHHATELPERVLKTAIARAEKMEQLVPGEHNKMAYLTGMYSLLDVLFDMEMTELMECISLDKTISKAILEGKGVLGESLKRIKREESHSLKQLVMDNFDKFSNEDLLELLEKGKVIDHKHFL
jgi:EAL and modified HD-GYP domain-containing signal transduction protein